MVVLGGGGGLMSEVPLYIYMCGTVWAGGGPTEQTLSGYEPCQYWLPGFQGSCLHVNE